MIKKIGILTGGGDCAGLNAVIGAVVKSATHEGWEVYGIRKGWEGAITGEMEPLSLADVDGIHSESGTILQTTRTNPYEFTGTLDGKFFEKRDLSARVIEVAEEKSLDAIIVDGGDDTLSVVPRLVEDYGNDVTFIGIPKTMDGDLQTYSLGLDSAINNATKNLKRIKTTLKSNASIGIVELFGRNVGRVTFKAGIASGSDVILIPEVDVDLGYTCNFIANKYNERADMNGGNPYGLIAVAEGTKHPITKNQVMLDNGKDSYGHGKLGGIGDKLAQLIKEKIKNDPKIRKHTNELKIQTERPTYDIRCGPTYYSDSYFGQKLGTAAVEYLRNGAVSGMAVVNFNEFGKVEVMPIEELIKPRLVHKEVLKLFERSGLYFFGRKPSKEHYEKAPQLSS